MRNNIVATLILVLVGIVAFAGPDEQRMPFDKLPKPVAETVKNRFPKAEQLEATKVTKGGKTNYEIAVKDVTRICDLTLTPEGKLLSIEKELPPNELPKPVTAAVEAKFPKCVIEIAAEFIRVNNNKETLEYYQVVIERSDKRIVAAEVAPSGQIIKTEDKTDMK